MVKIDEIKDRLDIVDVIGEYVELKPAGSSFKALSPFKVEKTPSFMVNPRLQIFKDFSSGIGGDVITFIQEIERVDFKEALKIAAEKAGIEIESYAPNTEFQIKKERALKAHEMAAKYYHFILLNHKFGKAGREYARKRGLDSKIIKKFQVGYAPNSRTGLITYLTKVGYSKEELIDFSLGTSRGNEVIDKFRNRLLQPIHDVKGHVVGFSGRYFGDNDNAPKYLNSAETVIFKKNDLLYGLFEARESSRKTKTLILVEGNIDVLSSHRVGVEHIVAPLGTAFTEQQAKLIKRYAEQVLFCFDTDQAGLNALIRSISIVEGIGLEHRVIDIGEFGDADELIAKKPEEWNKAVESPIDSVEFLLKKISEELDLGSPNGKVRFIKRVIPIIKSVKNPVAREAYIREVSLISQSSHSEVKKLFDGEKTNQRSRTNAPESEEEAQEEISVISTLSADEKYLLFLVANYPELKIEVDEQVLSEGPVRSAIVKVKNDREQFLKEYGDVLKEIEMSDISFMDHSWIQEPEKELKEVILRLVRAYHKKQVRLIGIKLETDPENEELQKQLAEHLRKVKKS